MDLDSLEKDGQSFLEKEPAPKPTPRMESTSLGTSKIYTRIPSPEDNINELRHMVYGNLRALMRDDEFFLHDIEKVLGIKSTLNALHWFSSHTKKPNLFQKLVLKLTVKYWSF